MSKAVMRFMREGTELWASFTSPKRLNTEFPSCAGDELEDLPPISILVKIESLECLPPAIFETRKFRNLVLSYPAED